MFAVLPVTPGWSPWGAPGDPAEHEGQLDTLCRGLAEAGKATYNFLVSNPRRPPLTSTVPCLCPQAADLVSENCETYEAHMRDIRDYLEERLEVSGRKASPAASSVHLADILGWDSAGSTVAPDTISL